METKKLLRGFPYPAESLSLLHCLLLLLLLPAGLSEGAQSSAENTKRIVDRMLRNYTRQNSPNGDSTTNVYIGIYIIGFYSISEATMDYSLTIYLRLQWTDPRLKFNSSQVGGKSRIKLEDNIWEKIWVPDVFLRNEKKADFHSVTIPNRFMNLESNGRIWYVIKLSVTLSCEMDLKKYPLDTQMCPMMFESFGHTMDTVAFHWLQPPKRPDDKPDDLTMPQFDLKKIHLKSCDLNYTSGAYPCLQMTFELKRDFGYFLIQIYIPTMLIVILSWFAFWLNIDAVPARVSLGLLTVLTITTQASGSKSSLPKVSYIKAIDVWMSACLGFVFASLLEFAIVNVYSRQSDGGDGGGGGGGGGGGRSRARNRRRTSRKSRMASAASALAASASAASASAAAATALAASRRRCRGPWNSGIGDTPAGVGCSFGGGDGGGGCCVADSPVFVRDLATAFHTALTMEANSSDTGASVTAASSSPQQPPPQQRPTPLNRQLPSVAKRIDKFSRRFFPLTFLLFNVVYWVYYLIIA